MEGQKLFFEKTSAGNLEVWQDGNIRSLYIQNKKAVQSQLDITKKDTLLLQHSRAMMSFLLFQNNPQSVLILGLGGGSIIHFLAHWFPTLKITAIDISEQIIALGRKYFGLSNTPYIRIKTEDAQVYLEQAKPESVDVMLVDLHDGQCSPIFLRDPKFMMHCFHALSSKGVLVINLLAKNEQDFTNVLIALREFFTGVSFCMTFKNQKNILLFAFKKSNTKNLTQLRSRATQYQKKYGIEFEEFIDSIVEIEAKIT